MKISKQTPEPKLHTVEIRRATPRHPGKYQVYLLSPVLVGEASFDGERTWVTDDGLTFSLVREVEKYFQTRVDGTGIPLEVGKYAAGFKSVKDDGDRLVLKTEDGNIVIARET